MALLNSGNIELDLQDNLNRTALIIGKKIRVVGLEANLTVFFNSMRRRIRYFC